MNVRFLSLASGSSGNCYFIGTSEYGILIDAGIGSRTIRKKLKEIGLEMNHIHAVFVTHDHYDHIKSVATLGEIYHLPIYATEKVHWGIAFNKKITEKLSPANKRVIKSRETVKIRDIQVTPFPLPHDATDNSGFVIEIGEMRLTLATDLGAPTDDLRRFVSDSDYLVVEANYDKEMLKNGRYPEFLKMRVSGANGHLSNTDTANLLSEHATSRLKQVCLCHLSKENNLPQLAVDTVSSKLPVDAKVVALPRNESYLIDEL